MSTAQLVLDQEFTQAWKQSPYFFEAPVVEFDMSLFTFERVQALMPEMKPCDVIYRDASGGVNAAMRRLPDVNFSEGSLKSRLDSETSSLMLQDVQKYEPAYAETLDMLIDWVASQIGIARSKIYRPSASFFLSSPNAVSSYHTDREENFLCQMHGVKTVHVFPKHYSLIQELAAATFRKRKGMHFEYQPEFEENAQVYTLQPSNCLYMPRIWPHWVQNGEYSSLSLSLNFFLAGDLAIEKYYLANNKLRRLFVNRIAGALKGGRG